MKINEKLPRKFHKGTYRFKLVKWVTHRHRPDSIVEDDDLISVFTYLNPEAKPPSRRTLRRDIETCYKLTEVQVKELLSEYEGRFNAIYDCWTAGNGHEFLALLVSFVHRGKLFVICLDMIEMTEAHTGVNLANASFALLQKFGIAGRMLGHTGDNASNNDKMLDHLQILYSQFEESIAGRDTQIRCFGHILNLIYHVGGFFLVMSVHRGLNISI